MYSDRRRRSATRPSANAATYAANVIGPVMAKPSGMPQIAPASTCSHEGGAGVPLRRAERWSVSMPPVRNDEGRGGNQNHPEPCVS
eukprot:131133-Chlamydomonas_euryale.AAC.1